MKWDDPEFIEAIRLISTYFPEAKPFISDTLGIYFWAFLEAMKTADYRYDPAFVFACTDEENQTAIEKKYIENSTRYRSLLNHTGCRPQGQAVIIPEALGADCYSNGVNVPFVCHSKSVPEKLDTLDAIFSGESDIIFAFESGEVLALDHDNRLSWASTKLKPMNNEVAVSDPFL